MLILGKEQGVGKWADTRAHVPEDGPGLFVAGHPEIDSQLAIAINPR